jgi:hypothetical protein
MSFRGRNFHAWLLQKTSCLSINAISLYDQRPSMNLTELPNVLLKKHHRLPRTGVCGVVRPVSYPQGQSGLETVDRYSSFRHDCCEVLL